MTVLVDPALVRSIPQVGVKMHMRAAIDVTVRVFMDYEPPQSPENVQR